MSHARKNQGLYFVKVGAGETAYVGCLQVQEGGALRYSTGGPLCLA